MTYGWEHPQTRGSIYVRKRGAKYREANYGGTGNSPNEARLRSRQLARGKQAQTSGRATVRGKTIVIQGRRYRTR